MNQSCPCQYVMHLGLCFPLYPTEFINMTNQVTPCPLRCNCMHSQTRRSQSYGNYVCSPPAYNPITFSILGRGLLTRKRAACYDTRSGHLSVYMLILVLQTNKTHQKMDIPALTTIMAHHDVAAFPTWPIRCTLYLRCAIYAPC